MGGCPPAVALGGVSRLHRNGRGLHPTTCALAAGVWGVLGPNGAGKTTLFDMVATARPPQEGRLSLWGEEVAPGNLRRIRRRIGFLPQEARLPPSARVGDYLHYVAALRDLGRREREEAVADALAAVHLEGEHRTRLRRLSGGMRQRVALARALLGWPDLLVLDEPTVGLDPEQRIAFRDLLIRGSEQRTILVSSHQVDDLAMTCTNVLVMGHGHCIYVGSTQALTATATGRVWISEAPDPGAIVTSRTADGRHRNLGTPRADVELVSPTLEDAYVLLVREVSHADEGRGTATRASS